MFPKHIIKLKRIRTTNDSSVKCLQLARRWTLPSFAKPIAELTAQNISRYCISISCNLPHLFPFIHNILRLQVYVCVPQSVCSDCKYLSMSSLGLQFQHTSANETIVLRSGCLLVWNLWQGLIACEKLQTQITLDKQWESQILRQMHDRMFVIMYFVDSLRKLL